jgi:hypothetical protein
VHGEPARPGLGLEQRVRAAGGDQQPVARGEPVLGPVEEQAGPAGEEDDPFVVVLQVVGRGAQPPAEDLLDDEAGRGDELDDALAACRRRRGLRE